VSKVHSLSEYDWRSKRDVMRYYDTIASAYNELHGNEQQSKFRAALNHTPVTDNAILDLGCGTGLFFSFVSTSSLLVGIDISSNMVIHAARRVCPHPRGHVICADADFLPLRDSIFDTVFAFTLLQNVASPHHTLQELSRVLKHNSNFILSSLKTFFLRDMIAKLLRRSQFFVTKWLSTTSKDYLVICKKVTFYSKNTK
jgi:ubiquinone/menaquinone biosynthesis C-methylase UbiE